MKTHHLLMLVGAISLSSCAFGDRNVRLEYETTTSVKASKPASVSIAKFADSRGLVEYGRVRNGYGMVTAKVLAQPGQDGGEWVAAALASELEKAGCKVSRGGSGASVTISGTLHEAFGDVYMTINTGVGVTITVKKGGATVLNKRYDGKNVKVAWAASSSEYQSGLKLALQDLMTQAIPDVLKAIGG
jgi:hypothetical protein